MVYTSKVSPFYRIFDNQSILAKRRTNGLVVKSVNIQKSWKTGKTSVFSNAHNCI